MTDVGELFLYASEDVTLVRNEDWQASLVVAVVTVEAHLDVLEDLTAPVYLREMHNHLLAVAGLFRQFASAALQGVSNLDDAELVRAAGLLGDGQRAWLRADAAWQQRCG